MHKYLGMTFYFVEKGKVKIKIDKYFERMIDEFQMKISKSDTSFTLIGNNIIEKGNIKRLGKKET